MTDYDRWLAEPYEPSERLACPVCGERMVEDRVERSVECPACGYWDAIDWDAVAEARAERDRSDGEGW